MPGTTQHHNHKDTNLEQHKCANLKLIAVVKLRGTLQKHMKIEDVRNTKVVAFILFQHSAYGQLKMIQSHGVWVSSLMNQNSIHEEIKSILSQVMLATIQCRIFCPLICYPKNKD